MAEEIGKLSVKLALEDSGFNNSMSGVNRSLKVLGAELGALRAKGNEFGNSVEGMRQKQDALGRTMQVQQQKVDQLKAAYERSASATGQYSEKSQRLAAQLNKAIGEFNRTEAELKKVDAALTAQQAELNQTESVWQKFQGAMDKASTSLQAAGDKMKAVGSGMTAGLSAPLAAFGATALKAASDFDASQGRIQAKLGLTEAEAKKVNAAAQNLYKQGFGENMQMAADNVANVAQNMRDIPADELENVAKQAMTVSDVFGQDINDVTKSANTLMKNFGVSSTEAFDLITTGFQNGLDYSGEFLDTLNEYSPQFSALGFSGADFFNTLASGAEAGAFNLDKVGDAVKEFNIRAKDGSKTTTEAFKGLGMDADKMSQTFAKGGPTAQKAFQQVVAALQKVEDPVKRNQMGVALFGTQFEDLEADVVAALGTTSGEFDKVNGATSKAGKAMQDNFGTRVTQAFRSFQEALLPLGEVLLNMAEAILPKLQSAIQVISGAFTSMGPTGQMIATVFGLIAAALGPLLVAFGFVASGVGQLIPVFMKVLPYVSKLRTAFTLIRTGLLLLSGPIGIAIALITGLGILIYKNWDTIKAKTTELFSTLSSYFSTGWEAIKSATSSFLTTLGSYFTTGWNAIKTTTATVLNGIGQVLATIWNGIKAGAMLVFNALKLYFTTVFNVYKTIFTTVWNGIKTAVTAVWNGIKAAAMVVFNALKAYFTTVINAYKTVFTTVWNAIKAVVTTVVNGIKSVITTVFNAVKSTITSIFNGIKSVATSVWNGIKSTITSIVNGIKSTITSVWNAIKSTVTSVMNGIKSAITSAWSSIKSSVSSAVNGIKSTVTSVWNAIKSTVSSVMSGIKSTVTSAWSSIKSSVSSAVNGIKSVVTSAWNSIKSSISSAMSGIKSNVTSAWNSIKSSVSSAVNGIKSVVVNVFNSLKSAVSSAMNGVKSAIQSGWNSAKSFLSGINLSSIGQNIIQGLVNGIKSKLGAIGDAVTAVANKVTGGIKKIMNIHSPSRVMHALGGHTGQGYANGISAKAKEAEKQAKTMANKVTNAIKSAEVKFDTKKINAKEYINVLKQIDKQYKLSAAQRQKIDKEIYAANQSMAKANQKKAAEQAKKVTEQMKNLEVKYDTKKIGADAYIAALKRIDAQHNLTAEQSRKMQAEIYAASKAKKTEAQKQAAEAQKFYTSLDKINDTYVAKVKDVAKKLAETEKKLTDEYKKEYSDRKAALSNFAGIFETIQPKPVDGEALVIGMKSQVKTLQSYTKSIETLKGAGLSKKLLDELQAQGPDAASELAALASLNDAQLAEYQRLYDKKNALAKKQTDKEMADEKAALEKRIAEERAKATKTIEAYKKEWISKIDALKKSTIAKMGGLSPEMKGAGKNAIKGMIDGMEAMRGPLEKAAERLAATVAKATKSALKIKSPSRLMKNEVGAMIPAGIAGGIQSGESMLMKKMRSVSQALVSQAVVPNYGQMIGNVAAPSMPRPSTISKAQNPSAVESTQTLNVNVPVYLDGKQIARVVQPYVDLSQQNRSARKSFTQGVRT